MSGLSICFLNKMRFKLINTYVSIILFGVLSFVSGNAQFSTPDGVELPNCGVSRIPFTSPDRIVGGIITQHGQHPWMISLRENDGRGFEHVCGATILNHEWILTAAHCIILPSPHYYEILAGLHRISEEHAHTVRRHKISKIILHKEYDGDTMANDIALLKLATPLDIQSSRGYLNGVCLPFNRTDPTGYATVIGWGHTKEDGEMSDALLQVVVPIIERSICNEMYDPDPDDGVDDITETTICAGMTNRDSCQYDSGGPLLQRGSGGRTTLIGIVSTGAGCGDAPGIYTKVSMYYEWIQDVLQRH